MSLQALGWISEKLGVNITGRNDTRQSGNAARWVENGDGFRACVHETSIFPGTGLSGDGSEPILEKCWKQVNQTVSSCLSTQGGRIKSLFQSIGSSENKSLTNGSVNKMFEINEAVNNELDKNGLPVSQNWYYYDNQLGRWNVLPEAPEAVRREYEDKLRAEASQMSQQTVAPPPPPPPRPPPPLPMMEPQDGRCVDPLSEAGDAAGKSMFSPVVSNPVRIQNRVTASRYSVPDYFNTSPPASMTVSESAQIIPAAPPPPSTGVYIDAYNGHSQQDLPNSSGPTTYFPFPEDRTRMIPPPPPVQYQPNPVVCPLPTPLEANTLQPSDQVISALPNNSNIPTASLLAAFPDSSSYASSFLPFPANSLQNNPVSSQAGSSYGMTSIKNGVNGAYAASNFQDHGQAPLATSLDSTTLREPTIGFDTISHSTGIFPPAGTHASQAPLGQLYTNDIANSDSQSRRYIVPPSHILNLQSAQSGNNSASTASSPSAVPYRPSSPLPR